MIQGGSSPARPVRVARSPAAPRSGVGRHPRGSGSPLNQRTIFRSQPDASRASDNSSAARPSTSTAARTPRSSRGRQEMRRAHLERRLGLEPRTPPTDARAQLIEAAERGQGLMSVSSHTPRLPTSPWHREENRHSSRTRTAHNHDEHTPSQSVSAGHSVAPEEERITEMLRRRRHSISARTTSHEDEQAPHENTTGNPASRPRRRPAARARASTSVPIHAPAPLESRAREDVMQSQSNAETSYDLRSQTCTSSSCERCPVCTLPLPCNNHGHGDENVPRDSRSGSSTDGVAIPQVARISTRAAATRFAGSEISGMHRRPRRQRTSQVDDEPASASVATQVDAMSITQDVIVENDVSWDHDAPFADPIGLLDQRILRETPSPSASRNYSPDEAENRSQVPDIPASSSRRTARIRKKFYSKPIHSDAAGEQASSGLDSCPVDDCPICLAPLVGKCVKTRCGHEFHGDCLEQHLLVTAVERPTCPLCRGEMRLKLPVSAEATSGNAIEVLHRVPPVDSRCHLDRGYTFLSLGSFADRPKMLYIRTSNEDKWTSAKSVMWTLMASVPTTVYLNFRSIHHVSETGAMKWLKRQGWSVSNLESTVSSGWPNGPYEGPVFEKDFDPGQIELLGSNCHEGTYFVFVELRDNSRFDALPWDLSQVLE